NYSYLICPDCGKKLNVFGESHLDAVAAQYGYPVLARVPIDPTVAQAADNGTIESVDMTPIAPALDALK
ncbi:MAG: P-loop NTPase, partial [Oscillospiraceae bacterium]|nr:P-loop NTPase [Oscillospiraceae bacterium]